MKILHIVEDFSMLSGGLRTVVRDLDNHLNKENIESFVISSKEEKGDGIFTVYSKQPWLYSKEWRKKLKDLDKKYKFDIFHIHGVWMYPQYISAKYCVENSIPFVISAHGMYEPWLWKKNYTKKKIYFNLLAKKYFKKAKHIHAITSIEEYNLEKIFKGSSIVQIPNLISEDQFLNKNEYNDGEKYILYLGRLDEKKGIDILLKAFSKIKIKDVALKIAGKINDYKKELDNLIELLDIKERVEFLGLVSGDEKIALIKNAFVLASPSYSEAIGMVNLEAAILKTPVVTTHQTGINPFWHENGGKLINPNISELTNALIEVLNWSVKERKENGEKLCAFVKENYSWDKKISDWKSLYKSCMKKINE